MGFPFYIARRYLFAKKSHNVINVISAISAAGIAVGTAALIIILSVFNGFNSIIESMLSPIEPDLAIMPSEGKFFLPRGSTISSLYGISQVQSVSKVLQDNVFVSYYGHQTTAVAKGVDSAYTSNGLLQKRIIDGEFSLRLGEVPYASLGSELAWRIGVNVGFVAGMDLYYPQRDENVSLANPMSSVNCLTVFPKSCFCLGSEEDNTLMVMDLEAMRELTGLEEEISSLEIRLDGRASPVDISRLKQRLQSGLDAEGMSLVVKDRYEQNPDLYRMMRMEKASIYLIMLFVVVIMGFSVFGSLSLLIIEKGRDRLSLRSMGADKRNIRMIFTLEGWMITLAGMFAGMIVGVIFCLLQQHIGIVPMPGNYIVEYYPVILDAADVLVAFVGIALSGWIIARLSTRLV